MFYEWVSAGAIFGIEAFFALFSFSLCVGAIFGLMVLIAKFIKAGSGD